MDKILRRQIDNVELRSVNEEERSVEFVASTGSVDSYRTRLNPAGWDLSRFQRNGVIGYQHDIYMSDDPDDVIGRGEAYVEDEQLRVRVFFEPADLNPKADKVFRKIQFGSISAVSVGFTSDLGHWGRKADSEDPDVYYYERQTLLEISVVNIPSNPDAVKRSIEEERALHEQEREIQDPEEKPAEQADETNIRLTIAKAQRLLAQNNIKQ